MECNCKAVANDTYAVFGFNMTCPQALYILIEEIYLSPISIIIILEKNQKQQEAFRERRHLYIFIFDNEVWPWPFVKVNKADVIRCRFYIEFFRGGVKISNKKHSKNADTSTSVTFDLELRPWP